MHTYKHAYIHTYSMHACTHSDIHPRIHTCMMHSVPNGGQTAAVTRPPPGVDYAKSTNLNLCQLPRSLAFALAAVLSAPLSDIHHISS